MRKVFSLALAFLMLSVAAFAVSVDNDKVGDSLVYPLYVATDGVNTDFEVINTSDVYSVVAKVIIRSKNYSQELRDFLIYLSPNDVFRATLSFKNGMPYVTSSDDSVLLGSASNYIQGNLDVALETPLCEDTNQLGYVTVVQATVLSLTKGADGTVDKKDIIEAYEQLQDVVSTENVLTGFAEINVVGSDTVAYNATAIDDRDGNALLSVANASSLVSDMDPTVMELEAALAKEAFYLPYYDASTFAVINFPTKLTQLDADCKASSDSPFFSDADFLNPVYSMSYYDMEENTETHQQCLVSPCGEEEVNRMPYEVQELLADTSLDTDMGWARITFTNNDNVTYTGAPAIGISLQATPDGMYILDLPYRAGVVE